MALRKPTPQEVALNQHVEQVLRNLADRGSLFQIGWHGLLRALVAKWHEGPGYPTDDELRAACARAVEKDLAALPSEPYQLTRRLGVHQLPQDVLLEEHTRVVADLRAIRANIQEYEGELKALDQTITRDDGHAYRTDFLKYKIAQNERARDQIVEYLENGITDEAIRLAQTDPFYHPNAAVFGAYHFRFARELYSQSTISEIANKFGDLHMEQVQWFEDLYHSDRTAFHDSLSAYITEQNVAQEIRESFKKHHRLAARAEVLDAALDVYCDKKLALFCNIVPIQIEGLLGDYCAELGVAKDDLRSGGLAAKLQKIQAKATVFVDFEYFRFHFPVIRNRVAHGRLDSAEAPRLADLLLLDLNDVCKRMFDNELPLNQLVGLVRNTDPQAPEPASLLRLAMMAGTRLPLFYGLETRRRDIEEHFSGEKLWNWIDTLADSNDPVIQTGIYSIVADLKRRDLDGRRGKAVLAKLKQPSERPTDQDFWRAVYRAQHALDIRVFAQGA